MKKYIRKKLARLRLLCDYSRLMSDAVGSPGRKAVARDYVSEYVAYVSKSPRHKRIARIMRRDGTNANISRLALELAATSSRLEEAERLRAANRHVLLNVRPTQNIRDFAVVLNVGVIGDTPDSRRVVNISAEDIKRRIETANRQ